MVLNSMKPEASLHCILSALLCRCSE